MIDLVCSLQMDSSFQGSFLDRLESTLEKREMNRRKLQAEAEEAMPFEPKINKTSKAMPARSTLNPQAPRF